MELPTILDENWQTLLGLLPFNWSDMAHDYGAVRRLRGISDEETLLRLLLLHVARGYSLRETVAIAKAAKLASISDVALLNRLRSSERWLWAMCKSLFLENTGGGGSTVAIEQINFKAVDGSIIREPGKTGSEWALHYALRLPSLECDEFALRPVKGEEARGESFKNFAVQKGDCLIGDRVYANAPGIHYVAERGGHVLVRVNTGALYFEDDSGKAFDLLRKVQTLRLAGQSDQWSVRIAHPGGDGDKALAGRVIAVRKTEAAAERAIKKLRQDASRRQVRLRPETLKFANYVILFTDLPATRLSCDQAFEWYRLRWQIELYFKRLKSLANTGHLPKRD
ncbi:MAG: transposase, partial [Myxococcota bacterium]